MVIISLIQKIIDNLERNFIHLTPCLLRQQVAWRGNQYRLLQVKKSTSPSGGRCDPDELKQTDITNIPTSSSGSLRPTRKSTLTRQKYQVTAVKYWIKKAQVSLQRRSHAGALAMD